VRIACIPAYNEEGTISAVVRSSLDLVDRVVVCDDGSGDGTARAARDAGAEVISHGKNLGYGAAIASLFERAREIGADAMVTIDGDGQHDPGQIAWLLDTLAGHNVDVVIGSRFLRDDPSPPSYRRAGIRIITSASNYGTNLKVSDSQSGFRAYSGDAIRSIRPTEPGMAVSTEILMKVSNKGLSLAEIPVTVSYGWAPGRNPVHHGVSVLANTLKYVSMRHPLKFFGVAGMVCLVAGIFLGAVFLDAYLGGGTIFYGSLLASIVLFLLGAILLVTAVMLFSMANLMRDRA